MLCQLGLRTCHVHWLDLKPDAFAMEKMVRYLADDFKPLSFSKHIGSFLFSPLVPPFQPLSKMDLFLSVRLAIAVIGTVKLKLWLPPVASELQIHKCFFTKAALFQAEDLSSQSFLYFCMIGSSSLTAKSGKGSTGNTVCLKKTQPKQQTTTKQISTLKNPNQNKLPNNDLCQLQINLPAT